MPGKCAECGRTGDRLLRCVRCRATSYCSKDCQTQSWKRPGLQGHKAACWIDALPDHPPSPPDEREHDAPSAVAAENTGGCDSHDTEKTNENDQADPEHPCPICLENEEDYSTGDRRAMMCAECGRTVCCDCAKRVVADNPDPSCPTCRTPLIDRSPGEIESYRRLHRLVHSRPPGRYTALARVNLALRLYSGDGVELNRTEAINQLTIASKEKSWSGSLASYNLATWFYDIDPPASAAHYACAAKRGEANSLAFLGNMFKMGHGVPQNDIRARKLWLAASEQKCPEAEYGLGVMYVNADKFGKRDALAAYRFLSRACRMVSDRRRDAMRAREECFGYVEMQYKLGCAYAAGTKGHFTHQVLEQGEDDDLAMAKKWLSLASEAGHEMASQKLASMTNI